MEGRNLWSELPVELKVEIFDRILVVKKLIWKLEIVDRILVLKKLFSLRVVCKDWNFVIFHYCVPSLSSPRAPLWGIISVEEERSNKGRNSFFRRIRKDSYCHGLEQDNSVIKRSILCLTPLEERGRYNVGNVIDCCNGMILIASSSNCLHYVGNPLTRQCFDVPVSPNARTTTRSSLVFDPSILECAFFKIVSFVRPAQEATVGKPMGVDIYSSNNAKWCSYVVELEPHHLYGFEWLPNSVYFNHTLYFLSAAMYLVCLPVPDSANQGLRARAVALPDRGKVSFCGCIGNCSGSLYYSNRNLQGSSILVWMLDISKWTLVHKISISEDIGRYTGNLIVHHTGNLIDRYTSGQADLAISKRIYDRKVKSLKKDSHFRPRLILNDGDNGMTLFIGPRGFLSYKVNTKSTEFQVFPNSLDFWKLEAPGERFFPFSPCPLVLKSPGTCKLVPYSTSDPPTPESIDGGNGTLKWWAISCAVGFVYCAASFILKRDIF